MAKYYTNMKHEYKTWTVLVISCIYVIYVFILRSYKVAKCEEITLKGFTESLSVN